MEVQYLYTTYSIQYNIYGRDRLQEGVQFSLRLRLRCKYLNDVLLKCSFEVI